MQKIFKQLFKQFVAKNGVEPKGIELLQMKFKANELKRQADKVKIVDFEKTSTKVRPGQEATVNTLRPKSDDVAPGTLQADVENLKVDAEDMMNDAIKNKNQAMTDLDDFIETGGQPFKKKDDKFLGGSMHEESQIRTGVRMFLQDELKNGRLKLNKEDTARVMEYFPTKEDDPILVFKKIYGDDAYNAAGKFPGAFERGEDYNAYREIFKENMGDSFLKVKTKENLGDGTLTLTDEVRAPIKDEDVPFAGGGVVKKIIKSITMRNKDPMDSMKELNEVLKRRKELDLTDNQVEEIMDAGNDWIFQRDPDNLFVPTKDKPKTLFDDEVEEASTQVFKDSEGGIKGITRGGDKKRLLTDDEIRDYEAEIGDSETWMMDGTVEEAEKALKDNKEYMADMKREYDAASPAERAEVIGTKKVNVDEDLDLSQGMIDLDELNFTKNAKAAKEAIDNKSSTQVFKDDKGGIKGISIGGDDGFKKGMGEAMEEGMRESENMKRLGLDPTSQKDYFKYEEMKEAGQMEKNVAGLSDMSESDTLMQKYPGMTKQLADQIANDPDPNRKANVIAMVEQTFKLSEQGKSGDEIIEIFKKGTDRTEQADGGPITSTGLNYLLGEDDNNRVPYAAGGRRGFLKLLAGLGTAGAAFKSGLISLKGGAKPIAKEIAKEAATGQPPAYFLNLVAKIKNLGDDVTETAATADRQKVTKFKDYEMTEDISTGNIDIIKKGILDEPDTPEVFMSLKVDEVPLKGKKGSTKVKEYEEFTGKRDYDGDLDVEPGVPDEVVQEGTIFEDTLSEFGKADGGRIDRSSGGIMKIINKIKNKLKIKQSGDSVKEFLEKRKFIKSMVGETEKNKKARELKMLKEAMEEARENPGFKFENVDIDKDIRPIFDQSKDRTLNAGGGIIKLIKKLNDIAPGSTKLGATSKKLSKKMSDKRALQQAIRDFEKRNKSKNPLGLSEEFIRGLNKKVKKQMGE